MSHILEKYSYNITMISLYTKGGKILEEVLDFMMQFDMIRTNKETKEFILMPIIFKMKGKYNSQFKVERNL